jgi:hypothetical protein
VQLARRQLLSCVVGVVGIVGAEGAEAAGELKCRGMGAYEMKLCLREARKQAEEEGGESRDDAFLKNRQYEQPGELVVTKEGVQYREIDGGNPNGRLCTPGRVCEVSHRPRPRKPRVQGCRSSREHKGGRAGCSR